MIRQFRVLWGPTLENAIDFSYPVVGDDVRFWRTVREGSEQLPAGNSTDVSLTGRDYWMAVTAKWFDLDRSTDPTNLGAFVQWANDGNSFTLVPDSAFPGLSVPGCMLVEPFTDPSWSVEVGGEMTVSLLVRHPTADLNLAWRGLFFEYVAGQNLADPAAAKASRASTGYEVTPAGYLLSHATDSMCDGHYPDRTGGLQTTLLNPAIANDFTFPEDLTNVIWNKSETTITANDAVAPDRNATADRVVESVTASAVHAVSQLTTIAGGDVQTALVFVHDAGRFNLLFGFNDGINGAGANKAFMQVNLLTGATAQVVAGTGSVVAMSATPLADGWWMLWIRGSIGGAGTSSYTTVRLGDNSAIFTYTGDGSSGLWVWGLCGVHGANNVVGQYVPASTAQDILRFPLPVGLIPTIGYGIYIQAVEGGMAYAPSGQFPALLTLGTFGSAPNWRTIVDMNNGTVGQYSVNTGNSGTSVTSSSGAAAPSYGQPFELLALVYPDGSVQMIQSVAGGAESVGTRSAVPNPIQPYFTGANGIDLGEGGGYASDVRQIARIKVFPFDVSGPFFTNSIAKARLL